jgi:exonuclease III
VFFGTAAAATETEVDPRKGKYRPRKPVRNKKIRKTQKPSRKNVIKINRPTLQSKSNSNKIKIAHLNIGRSINTKKDLLEIFLDDEKIDIFLVTEHGLKDDKIESINLENYNLVHHFSRKEMRWGGAALFMNNKLDVSTTELNPNIYELSQESVFEPSFSSFNFKDAPSILIGSIYRSPDHNNLQEFFNLLNEFLIATLAHKNKILIGCDLNINICQQENEEVKELQNILKSHGLHLIYDENTTTRISEGSNSCIDNFITNIDIFNPTTTETFISDHLAIVCEFLVQGQKNLIPSEFQGRHFTEENLKELKRRLSWESWEEVLNTNSTDKKFENFMNTLKFN